MQRKPFCSYGNSESHLAPREEVVSFTREGPDDQRVLGTWDSVEGSCRLTPENRG